MSDYASNHLPDLVGHTIDDGHLLLVDILGRGGYGVVYRAVTTDKIGSQRMHFAVKCIYWDFSQRSGLPQEIDLHRICSQASNSVLKIYDVVEDEANSLLFIVMDYCPDGDLLDMIVSGRYAGNNELIRSVYIQILDSVQACHQLNVMHRDLKPENILCKDGGKRIVLADFGLASMDTSSKQFHLGSDAFMSPEVLGGLRCGQPPPYSTRLADIWALGVILMNLTCGCHPWAKASITNRQFMKYLMDDPDYLLHTFPISVELNVILKSIFTPYTRHRTSIAELRERIRNVPRFGREEVTTAKAISTAYEHDLASGRTEKTVLTARDGYAGNAENETVFTPAASFAIDVPSGCSRVISSISTAVEPFFEDDIIVIMPMAIASDADSEDSDSDDESEGPITPEQHAVDVGLAAVHLEDVPDFTEEDGLGAGIGAVTREPVHWDGLTPLPVVVNPKAVLAGVAPTATNAKIPDMFAASCSYGGPYA